MPPTVLTSLSAVDGLRAGRTAARETPPVMPVTDAQIEATLPFMPQVVQDMIRVQLYTGMRPGELCQMRATDIEVAGELWGYHPRSHKTQRRGRERPRERQRAAQNRDISDKVFGLNSTRIPHFRLRRPARHREHYPVDKPFKMASTGGSLRINLRESHVKPVKGRCRSSMPLLCCSRSRWPPWLGARKELRTQSPGCLDQP